ncbi:enoyl-CoA hydratase/isomerase family protein [Plantactinospora sp. KBS50]|uniref:enoyl-CoA hydratase/isomerase family protein n=1 Tax=Plantactinospora sp. KBS50 TaxID=2024580 RepID=UPI0012FDA4F6|nr:enoyl-CoA hydratase/isomerase family protein [Plantactinospora sp. KBS50]
MNEMFDQVPGLVVGEPEPGVFELLIDRPHRRNAVTEEMMRALPDIVERINNRPDAAVLIVRGSGRAFCAGADLGVVNQRRRTDPPWRWPQLMGREAELLDGCEVTTIAVVDGPAVGLGMGLALSADICVVEPDGYFAEAHLALGLAPTAMAWWLPRMVGLQRASDIILTGRRVAGAEAAAIGLAARLAEPGQGRATALAIAREVADKPRDMARYAKLALRVAQDRERMTQVRQFGGMANRMHRAWLAAEHGAAGEGPPGTPGTSGAGGAATATTPDGE